MSQVLTNNTGLQYAKETTPGVLPGSPDWKILEPNSISDLGATVETESRNPISKLRQRRKGTVTGVDASLGYDADLTMDVMHDFAEAFLYTTITNDDCTFRAANATATGYTIPAATAAQAAKFQYTAAGPISLVHAEGYATAANNSTGTVKPLSADLGSTDTEIQVAGLSVETAPTNAEVSLAGIRAEDGDLALAVSSGVGTLTSGNNAAVTNIDFTTLGLTVGQFIHVGGLTSTNRFGSTAGGSNDSYGLARVTAIAAGSLTLDKMDATLTASDGTDTGSSGTDVFVDLLFGRFIRNVAVDDSDYQEQTFQFEGSLPNLFETEPPTPVANPDGFGYVTAAQPNTMVVSLPVRSKATVTFAFVGRDAEEPVDNGSRKTNASTARLPLFTGALNTSADIFRLRITDVDETGLMSDFKDLTLTIDNQVTPEYVLGTAGARFINVGNLLVNMTGEALFLDKNVADRIRANTEVTGEYLLRNDDGAFAGDFPSCTIKGNGGVSYPVGETVRIGIDIEAHVDDILQTSHSFSFFPVYPAS